MKQLIKTSTYDDGDRIIVQAQTVQLRSQVHLTPEAASDSAGGVSHAKDECFSNVDDALFGELRREVQSLLRLVSDRPECVAIIERITPMLEAERVDDE